MLEQLILPLAVAGLGAVVHLAPHGVRLAQEQTLRRKCAASRSLVLTYDDGPGRRVTPRLLDLLGASSAQASFFVLGRRVAGHEDVVDRIVAEGHDLGCHGQEHLNAWKTWPWRVSADMRTGYATLSRWTQNGGLFRPPYGKLIWPTWWESRRRGARLCWWTVVSGDTHTPLPQPQTVANAVAQAGGGVVLMHDHDRASDREAFVLQTTELLLETARREGLMVCRYSDLWRQRAKVGAMP